MKNLLLILTALWLLVFTACEKEASVLGSTVVPQKALKAHLTNGEALADVGEEWILKPGYKNEFSHNTYAPCDCFSMEELKALYNVQPWPFGWFSDLPGSCKEVPYDQLMEIWLTNIGQPAGNYDFNVQAGTINGSPFASKAKFNHRTGQFEVRCGGYTTAQNASNCALILRDFIDQMRTTHPDWDYCMRFP